MEVIQPTTLNAAREVVRELLAPALEPGWQFDGVKVHLEFVDRSDGGASMSVALLQEKDGTGRYLLGPITVIFAPFQIKRWENQVDFSQALAEMRGVIVRFWASCLQRAAQHELDRRGDTQARMDELIKENMKLTAQTQALSGVAVMKEGTTVVNEVTLDDFACAAMQAIVTAVSSMTEAESKRQLRQWKERDEHVQDLADGVAVQAYHIAEAMVKERDRR